MKKIFFAVALSIAIPAIAGTVGEWALIDSSGTVVNLRLSDAVTILNRNDGPWVKAYKRVGIGYHYDGLHFSAPAVSSGTFKAQSKQNTNKQKTRRTQQKTQ